MAERSPGKKAEIYLPQVIQTKYLRFNLTWMLG